MTKCQWLEGGQIDSRVRKVFPHRTNKPLGGCSCLLFDDFGQLPPVMDLPLYTTTSRTNLSDKGSSTYQLFQRAIVLDQVMRQSSNHQTQILFRNILMRLRNGQTTVNDWHILINQTPTKVSNIQHFVDALHLYPTTQAVVEYNVSKFTSNGHPIATVKAVHTGKNASKCSPDDAGGLESIICLAHGARVMLTTNLWVETGLVNGSRGTVVAICYKNGDHSPNLPIAVTV